MDNMVAYEVGAHWQRVECVPGAWHFQSMTMYCISNKNFFCGITGAVMFELSI